MGSPLHRELTDADERVQREVVLRPPVLGADPIDRFSVAVAAGAKGVRAERLAELRAFADGLGFDGAQAVETLADYNAAMTGWPEAIRPAQVMDARPLSEAPFYALEVRPGITFTFGGLSVDDRARVLDPAGVPVPGLFAAGADAGNVFRAGYAGGLALAGTFGFRAAMELEAA